MNTLLREDFSNNMTVHVGEAAVYTVMAHREFFVVYSQEVQDGCVKVVAPGFLLRFPSPFVALAV